MTSQVSIHRLSVTLASLLGVSALLACAPTIRATRSAPIGPTQLAELWTAPTNQRARNLFFGVGGQELAPTPGAQFTFLAKDTTGYSPGYDVKDMRGMEWSVKFGPEAPAEVVASRLIWAVGYHQPPTYFVPKWTLVGGETPGPQPVARFRPKLPWQEKVGEWSWHQNPFVGTVPYRGLIVLM
ncbi:MAG: hypothetical protein ACRD1T_04865, partial [Acidimicrobiia bacterium]